MKSKLYTYEVKFKGPELDYKVNVCAKSSIQAKSKVYKSLHPSAKALVSDFESKKINGKCMKKELKK